MPKSFDSRAPAFRRSLEAEWVSRLLTVREITSRELAQPDLSNPLSQPVHTVYGGANLFKSDTAVKLGKIACRVFAEYAPNWVVLARVLKLPGYEDLPAGESEIAALLNQHESGASEPVFALARTVYSRVSRQLRLGAVQDLRVDFEDGYGNRPDAEEDEHARAAALAMAEGMRAGTLPPFIGIRIKPLTPELAARSVRTLDIFITELVRATGGLLPENFAVTLPKVSEREQVLVLGMLCQRLEDANGLAQGAIKLELMIETARSLIDHHGRVALPALAEAAGERLRGVAFGTYDYTAELGIAACHQSMNHPACDMARLIMRNVFAGTKIWTSDGATTTMPIPPHKAAAGQHLSAAQMAQNVGVVHAAWKEHYDNILRSLEFGFTQGWDLNPAQLPMRWAAVHAFFLRALPDASARLNAFVKKAAQATLSGNTFDDAATGQGLLNFMLQAIECGAVTESEVVHSTGLSLADIRSRSFLRIADKRNV